MQPCSHIACVDDPGRYERMLCPHGLRLTLSEPGNFAATYFRAGLQHVQLQSATESLPRILEGTTSGRNQGILLHLEPGPCSFVAGEPIDNERIGLFSGLHSGLCHRLTGPSHWATVFLKRDDWVSYGSTLTGRASSFPPFMPALVPVRPALEKLRGLLQSINLLARNSPELLRERELSRGFDDALIRAALGCMVADCPDTPTEAWRHHARVVRRFTTLIEESEEHPLYLAEVCLALNVSGRTLRQCCHEYFGMGPKRYLMLRRLHLARDALLASSPGLDTVTGIATHFGFWELGRFAVAYRRLFGETPLTSLRRPAMRDDAGIIFRSPIPHSVQSSTMADRRSSPVGAF